MYGQKESWAYQWAERHQGHYLFCSHSHWFCWPIKGNLDRQLGSPPTSAPWGGKDCRGSWDQLFSQIWKGVQQHASAGGQHHWGRTYFGNMSPYPSLAKLFTCIHGHQTRSCFWWCNLCRKHPQVDRPWQNKLLDTWWHTWGVLWHWGSWVIAW